MTSYLLFSDMRIVEAFKQEIGEEQPLEEMTVKELDFFLSKFFMSVKKADGEEYEPDSLTCIQSSIARYLR